MDPVEYEKMADVEDQMWWYEALHRVELLVIRKLSKNPAAIVDAGCGTGGFIKFVAEEYPACELSGVEIWEPACEMARKRTGREIMCGSVNDLPLPDASVDVVVCADVLCHQGVEIERSFAEAFRCLRAGGLYLLNLPACDRLKSYHDKHVGTVHRFSMSEARRLMAGAGFQVAYRTHWNSILFPAIALRRLLLKGKNVESDVKPYARPIEAMFTLVMRVEHAFLRAGGRFPFGLSILIAGIKPHRA